MMKTVLITGANGFLGQHLTIWLHNRGYNVVATGRGHSRLPSTHITYCPVDLTSQQQVADLLHQYQPQVVVHTAAMSKPDECDRERETCLLANVEATRYLSQATNGYFIYTSTDFVFGEDGPHAETAEPAPLNFYGATKLQAEQVVRQRVGKYAIMRPVFIYGRVWPGLRPSFLHWVQSNLVAGKTIKVVSDQQRTPTYVGDLCKGIETMIAQEATGDFHLAGSDVISPYQMAVTVARVLGLDETLIEKVTSETFPEPVRRAKRSGLTIHKAMQQLQYQPVSFAEGVRLTFNQAGA